MSFGGTMDAQPINRKDDPRWIILGNYIRDVADSMGLDRWHFDLSHDPTDSDGHVGNGPTCASSQVDYTYQTLSFTIRFGDIFFENYCPEQQRHVVVHELCHIVETSRMGAIDILRREDCISTQLWNHWYGHYDRERERAIDWFSSLIAPRFPFIQWENAEEKLVPGDFPAQLTPGEDHRECGPNTEVIPCNELK